MRSPICEASDSAETTYVAPNGTVPTQAPAATNRLTGRKVVFLNLAPSWRVEDLSRVLANLMPGLVRGDTQLLAVGDWRSEQQDSGRLLAARGARLIQRAPELGDRSRKGVSLGVAVGLWLGCCNAGDVLEIVSEVTDDPAFDAVSNLTAMRGVIFRRPSRHEFGPSVALDSRRNPNVR